LDFRVFYLNLKLAISKRAISKRAITNYQLPRIKLSPVALLVSKPKEIGSGGIISGWSIFGWI